MFVYEKRMGPGVSSPGPISETYLERIQTTVAANQKVSVSMIAGEDKNTREFWNNAFEIGRKTI